MDIKRILVPTDFSDPANEALQAAIDFAQKYGAKIYALNVVEPAAAAPLALAGIVPQGEMVERLEASAREAMRALQDKYKGKVELEGYVAVGSPASEVVRQIDKHGIDLVVTATHGRTGLAHMLMGSVAERIVRLATCPVLVVPTKKDTKA